MWQGIQRQTRRDMTVDTISAVWQQPGESQFLVCLDSSSGALLGCVAVARRHTLEKEARRGAGVPAPTGDASLWRLTVAPAARRLGAGRALMAAAEDWARAHGCRRMTLICGNRESQQFYRRVGYGAADEARARLVLFGPSGAPARGDVLGWLRLALLRTRVRRRGGTVMERALGEQPAAAAE
jgi:GNAT superfamily N-acetyltransferase